jgi:signal transduction histidine kinase
MALITSALIIVVGIPVGHFVMFMDRSYREFSTNMIETTTQIVYQYIYDGMMKNDSLTIQKNLELLAMEPNIELIRIYRPKGKILYSSKLEELRENIFDLEDEVYIESSTEALETFIKVGNMYSHHHPIFVQKECTPCHVNQGEVIGIMDVHAGFTDSEYLFASAKKITIFGAIAIIIILWLITNFLYQSQVETKLLKIIHGFDNLAKGNLKSKITMSGRHELAKLAEKFNDTVEKLKGAKQKEEQFYLEKLERADRLVTLGEVAAEIAHEVNNPAGIILTRAEIVKDEIEEKCPDCPTNEDLDIIIQQTGKIAEITRSILHYARKLPQTFAVTDLNEVIEHSVKIMQPRIKKKNVNLKFDSLKNPTIIWGNFSQLEQVFCNLINNSLDVLSKSKGKINIQIKNDLEDGNNFQIFFEDNGPGVPLEYVDQIFSPFFTTKEEGKGTGLGLFITKNIINNHKGTISLQNDEKKGIQFLIELEKYNE